jgi:hypothetical protein
MQIRMKTLKPNFLSTPSTTHVAYLSLSLSLSQAVKVTGVGGLALAMSLSKDAGVLSLTDDLYLSLSVRSLRFGRRFFLSDGMVLLYS